MSGFSNLECTNCGYTSWGVKETGRCSKCGALMVNTEPTVTHKELSEMTVEEVQRYNAKFSKNVIADGGRFRAS